MRMILPVLALAMAAPVFAQAQTPYGAPRGSYQGQCTNIRMNGQFLSATCRGARGGGESSINVASCSGDIGVDASGALSCAGPGAVPPPPPGRAPLPAPGYDRGPGSERGAGRGPAYGRADHDYGREAVTVFTGRNGRGESRRIDRPTPNLSGLGLNDRIRSIQLVRGSGPWIVCTDADYRGRCTTIRDDVADTRDIGMRDAISSLRPAR